MTAAEEERFSRVKHHSGFPYMAMQYCLDAADIKIADVEHVALYWKPWVLRHKAMQALKSAVISRDMFRARVDRGVKQVGDSYLGMLAHPRRIRKHFGPGNFRFHFLDHHQSTRQRILRLAIRAGRDPDNGRPRRTPRRCSRAGKGTSIRPLKRIKLPHSLGQFYSAVTLPPSASTCSAATSGR